MKRVGILLAGLVMLSVAGCGFGVKKKPVSAAERAKKSGDKTSAASGNKRNAKSGEMKTVGSGETLGNDRVTKKSIVGRWNVILVAAPGDADRLASGEFNLRQEFDAAINGLAQGDAVDDPDIFDWLKIEAEFRSDGTCSLLADNLEVEGTWKLDGDTLALGYQGQAGQPATVTRTAADEFTLRYPDRPTFAFVRAD